MWITFGIVLGIVVLFIWNRVPVVIVAKTDYGDVRMEITDYAAGTGARLADGALSGN